MKKVRKVLRAGFGPRIPEFLVAAFILSIPYIVVNFGILQEANNKLTAKMKPEYIMNQDEEFDYIIVGGGSAGSVVANRLSQIPSNRVLLLELGGDPNPFQDLPSFMGLLYGQKPIFHLYNTDKLENKCSIPVGRGLSGSSGVNDMVYLRGSPADFNEWARITNDPIWSYQNVLKAFKKSEDYHGPTLGNAHGIRGELYVSQEASSPVLRDAFFKASKEHYLHLRDFNTEFAKGYGAFDVMIKHGVRWDTYKAFIKPVLQRTNLKIYRYSKAIEIRLDSSGKADGVTYIRHGVKHYARAIKEIIISAGAIETAKLLLLSGIGPKQHLKAVGVKSLVDLPVGEFFQNHANAALTFSVNKGLLFNPRRDLTIKDITNYVAHGTGPLGMRNFNPGGSAAFTSSFEEGNNAYPDLEIITQAKTPFPPASSSKDYFYIYIILLRPKSYGYVQLSNKIHEDDPKVNPKYLTAISDLNRLTDGLQYSVDLIETTSAFKSLNATFDLEQGVPECNSLGFKSEKYWKCLLRHQNPTGYHVFGSCRMGQVGDPKAVVDKAPIRSDN